MGMRLTQEDSAKIAKQEGQRITGEEREEGGRERAQRGKRETEQVLLVACTAKSSEYLLGQEKVC